MEPLQNHSIKIYIPLPRALKLSFQTTTIIKSLLRSVEIHSSRMIREASPDGTRDVS